MNPAKKRGTEGRPVEFLWVTALALISNLLILALLCSCSKKPSAPPPAPPELAKASRLDTNGWINVHLEGAPREIGLQHGWLLAAEIDDALRALAHFLEGSTKHDWAFYRRAAERMLWPKLDLDYRGEIEGIATGLRARLPHSSYDHIDITALNGWIELAWYYVPHLDELARKGAGDNKAPGYCSA